MPEERPELGPIATKLLYEDERVRIWDQLIEPGATTGPHHHALPYALVTVEGTELEVRPVPGYPVLHTPPEAPEDGAGAITVALEDRTTQILPEGSVEEAINRSDRAYRAVLVEFKSRDAD